MKKTIKVFIVMLMMFSTLSISNVETKAKDCDTSVYIIEAEQNSEVTRIISTMEEVDQFIKVINNNYYLELPVGTILDNDLKEMVSIQLESTNGYVNFNLVHVDPITKKFIQEDYSNHFSTFAFGVTKIEFYWNYARVYLNATAFKMLSGVTVAAIIGFLGASTGPFAGFVLGAIGFIASEIVDNIKDGVRFDVNYLSTLLGRAAMNIQSQ